MGVVAALADLVLPRHCAGCGAEGITVCGPCRAAVLGPPLPRRPAPCPAGFPPTVAPASYEGVVRALAVAHKDHAPPVLTRLLGAVVAAGAAALADGPVVLVPVPSSRAAVTARGHDHTALLARRAAAVLRSGGWPSVAVLALRHTRAVADQAGLGTAARRDNLTGALEVARRRGPVLRGQPVVVVDDVVTTGATLTETARALRAAGARVLGAAVVAATERRSTSGPNALSRRTA